MSSRFRIGSTLVIVIVFGILVAVPLQAEPPTQALRPARDGEQVALDRLPPSVATQSLAEPAQPTAADYSTWSRITFQSYRDDNWEVYIANGDGSSQMRLTAHGASDTYPRLNRGGTRIAFVSNRTGNNEVFTMNPDGSGLAQLTATPANEFNPAWSPDGSKIVFNSYRDGQSEIYVMSADGSGQTRLTNHAAYDGHPVWSPDGAKIAFISDRASATNTGPRIWVMNANGSGQVQLSAQAYSENPNWSPDGARIAYDADGNNDGWQEIWLMNTDGSNQAQVYDPPEAETDAYVRSWSPDGKYVGFTRLTFIYYQGNWYWLYAYLDAWDSTLDFTIRLSSYGVDWYPDWQTIDIQAPASRVSGLSPYSRNPARITWSGRDSGAAGLKNYDIQYRQGAGGAWTDWLVGTTATSASFEGTPGSTYDFRSRARDNAENVESWTMENGDTSTTLYTWEVAGTVRDIRDTPIAGARISTTPEALVMFPSDDAGALSTYVAVSTTTYEATWGKAGYGSLPPVSFDANTDGYLDAVLPPADNAVVNGDFEANGGTLAGWTWDGEFTPTVSTNAYRTGRASAFLGHQTNQVSLTLPESIEGGTYTYPDIGVDREGAVHVLFVKTFSGIYHVYRTDVGSWVGPTLIGTYGNWHTAVIPKIVVTPDGDVHGFWNGEQGIYYSRRLSDNSWATQTVIGPGFALMGNDYCQDQDAAADSQGGLHVVYWCWHSYQEEVYYRHRLPDRTWLSNEYIGGGRTPGITVGPGDVVYVWYSGSYQERAPGGMWSASAPLPCGNRIVVDQDGTLHAICAGGYTNKPRGLPWSAVFPLGMLPGWGDLAVDSEGVVYVVNISGLINEQGTYFRYRQTNGQWSEPQMIDDNIYGLPAIVSDPSDNIHLVYEGDWSANHYRTNIRALSAATSAITQTLVIPANSYSPTLSFFYKLSGANPGDFKVYLSDGLVPTTVFSTSNNVHWTHAWVDLSPWSGRAVTLAMHARTIAGGNYTHLHLDEVSVGSAYPDVWLSADAVPNTTPAGKPGVYTVLYGNRGGAPASEVWITDTLPDELRFIAADPMPTVVSTASLKWNLGDLSAMSGSSKIVITTTVTSTATAMSDITNTLSIGPASPELEMGNNIVHVAVFIGHRLYLPLVMRE